MSQPEVQNQQTAIKNSIWWMVGILLLAVAFRFLAVDAAPPGWRDDELIEFGMDRRIADGWRPLFITEAEGHEPFYHYLHAGTILLFGDDLIGYKWLPFAFGLLTVSLTYALARRMFGVGVALLAAALLAVSFWPIMYSRLGVRQIGILPLMLGAFYLLYPSPQPVEGVLPGSLRARMKREARILVAGILLAAALMTYFAGRALPIVLVGFLAYLLIFHRAIFRRVWLRYLVAIGIAVLIAAPMFIEISRTPGAEKRTEVVGGPLIELGKGNVQPAIDTTLGTLGMFTFAGDPESLYNVSGRPVFDWITGIAFYLGVLLALVRLKRIECGFALVWLFAGIAPGFVSLPAASFSHTIAAQPVVYMLAAYGAVVAGSWLNDKLKYRGQRAIPAGWQDGRAKIVGWSPLLLLTLSLIVIGAVLSLRDYFGTWANDWQVRFQYHAPTREVARWLDQRPEIVDVAVGTHPNELLLDPLALKLDLKRRDVNARWFSAESALVLSGANPVVLTGMQSPGKEVQQILAAHGDVDGHYSAFDVYTIRPLVDTLPYSDATFDETKLAFLGDTRTLTGQARPGQPVQWSTGWRVNAPLASSRLKMFLHLLNDKGEVIAGNDREDVNFATLGAGDGFWHVSQITLPKNLPSGLYPVEVGWYNPETGERLQREDGTDRLLLEPVEVTAP